MGNERAPGCLFTALLLVLVLLVGCVAAFGENTALRKGQTTAITLDENPTTGYVWTAELSNPDVLGAADAYESDPWKSDADGGPGGKRTFTFKALQKGECIITLRYQRTAEDKPIETKQFTVTVE